MAKDEKPKCGAIKPDGQPCRKGAGAGTNHPGFGKCSTHFGCTDTATKAAARTEAELALADMPMFGIGAPIAIDPYQAIIMLVNRTAGILHWLDMKIAAFNADHELIQNTGELGQGPSIPSAWVKLHGEERDRLARYAKMAIDCGIAERFVKIAEQQGVLLAKVIQLILDDLELSDSQQERVASVVRNRLLQMPALEAKLAA